YYVLLIYNLSPTQPNKLAASFTSNDVTCFGGNNGDITFTSPAGGSGAYQYALNGQWQSNAFFGGLNMGSYIRSIRDNADTNCVIVLNTVSIGQPKIGSANV